jgi:hypothetical protein
VWPDLIIDAGTGMLTVQHGTVIGFEEQFLP